MQQRRGKLKSLANYYFFLLSRREYGAEELRKKALDKGYPLDEIEKTLTHFAKEGYQSDLRWATAIARGEARKGYGPHRIRLKLRSKGAAQEILEEALSTLPSEEEILRTFLQTRSKAPTKEQMIGRGFSIRVILDIIPHTYSVEMEM